MKTLLLIASLIVLAAAIPDRVLAQSIPCGNSRINRDAIQKALDFEKKSHSTAPANRTTAYNTVMRVYFHVFNDDDGSNGAATQAQMNTEFANLLAYYAPDGICFQLMGMEFINSTAINENFNADNDKTGTALASYLATGCLNIFYLNKIGGNNTACNACGYGGITLSIPDTSTLIGKSNVGDGVTIAHEVGHALGLFHTFETANGKEDIDGSNGSSTADLIADTPADPFAYNNQKCFIVGSCNNYTGSCPDPNGKTNFSPPYSNMMSYWYNYKGTCTTTASITNGQYTRVSSTLNTYTPLQNCFSAASLLLSAQSASSGYFARSAVTTVTTSGSIVLTGSTQASLSAGTVLLEPGFVAAPGAGGLTHINTNTCN